MKGSFNTKPVMIRFKELSELLEEDMKNNVYSKYFGVLKALSNEHENVRIAFEDLRLRYLKQFHNKNQSFEQTDQTSKDQDHLDTSLRFLIAANERDQYQKQSFITYADELVQILFCGKSFKFRENRKVNAKKSKFTDSQEVCYVYYKKNVPNWTATDFMEAMLDYQKALLDMTQNGVKVRHSPELAKHIKGLPIICDGRDRVIGCSWIAVDEDAIYFISRLLSPVEIENNLSLNGYRVQCWKVSKRLVDLNALDRANLIIFESNAIPKLKTKAVNL